LTGRRSFDVIGFADRSFFRIGKSGGLFVDMRLKDEFYFAPAPQIHRILPSPQTSNQFETLHSLTLAPRRPQFEPVLAWQPRFAGGRVR
jgi:hypothetical protein